MTNRPRDRMRVLLVPDSTYWITNTIANEICRHNPWIEPTICSLSVLRKILHEHSGVYPGNIDLVHFLTPHIATEFIGAFRSTLPCVATIHHVEDERSLAPASEADAIMTVCRQWHSDLLERGIPADKCVMVSNGADVSLFAPPSGDQRVRLRREFGIPENSVCVGFSGKRSSNTLNRKGIETFSAAMRLLADVKTLCFVIIGPGWHDFVNEQRQAGVKCIYIPFLIDRTDVASFYKAIDFYWVTSKIEGGPVPLLEAMSSELTCISSPVGVALEVITPGQNGFMVPFDAADVYADLTRRLSADPKKRARIGRAARETIKQRFQWSSGASAVGDLYGAANRNFLSRTSGSVIRRKPGDARVVDQNDTMASLPQSMHARMMAEEHLAFMEHLIESGVKYTAIRVGVRAVAACPTLPGVWLRVATAIPKMYATKLKVWLKRNLPFAQFVYKRMKSSR
jgi:glycosyltransferase involved in cell wall biosynthesis